MKSIALAPQRSTERPGNTSERVRGYPPRKRAVSERNVVDVWEGARCLYCRGGRQQEVEPRAIATQRSADYARPLHKWNFAGRPVAM